MDKNELFSTIKSEVEQIDYLVRKSFYDNHPDWWKNEGYSFYDALKDSDSWDCASYVIFSKPTANNDDEFPDIDKITIGDTVIEIERVAGIYFYSEDDKKTYTLGMDALTKLLEKYKDETIVFTKNVDWSDGSQALLLSIYRKV